MKKSGIMIAAGFFICMLWTQDILARGGAGRGGGAQFRAGGAANRSPSMSRPPSTRPSVQQPSRPPSREAMSKPAAPAQKSGLPKQSLTDRPGTGGKPSSRPGGSPVDRTGRPDKEQLQQFLDLPKTRTSGIGSDIGRIGAGAAAGALGAEGARRLLEGQKPGDLQRPAQSPEKPGIGQRPGDLERPSQVPAKPVSDQIRNNLQNRYDHAFTPQWWRDHPNAARGYWHYHHDGWYRWWRPVTWAALTGFVAGSALASFGEPIYYDYGNTVYYEGDYVYVGGQKTVTAEEYYEQAGNLAASAPAVTDSQTQDWLPLGVFALSQGNATYSNMILQLAINKNGEIAGTFYNTTTDVARPIKGMVDKTSQRAAWTFADGKNTDVIMETGIYNLTQDQTEALVHFGKDNTQQWLMVRLNEPEERKEGNGKKPDS